MFMIGDHQIRTFGPPLIIAEMSGNHNQSLDRALQLVEVAAKAGAHALKLQTYTADTMTIDINVDDFFISNPSSLWKGETLYELYKKAMTPWEWHKPIFDKCRELGILGFSTPFDVTAVDFLKDLDVPCYKVASFENVDLELIRRVARTGKPMIISTGMANISEIAVAAHTAREAGCNDLILLKCTSSYPAPPEATNLLTIPHMRDLFGCEVGLSDHTLGIGVAVASVAMGAVAIEKHFTTSRNDKGVDSAFSLEPDELAALVTETTRAAQALGVVDYGPGEAEVGSLQFRRSLYVVENVKAGDILTRANLRVIRPGFGLTPKYIDVLLGKRVNRDIARGTAMSWELIA